MRLSSYSESMPILGQLTEENVKLTEENVKMKKRIMELEGIENCIPNCCYRLYPDR